MKMKYSTREIRERAIRAIESGHSVVSVAERYGVHRRTLHRWLERHRQLGEDGLNRKVGSGRPRHDITLTGNDLLGLVGQPASECGFETDFWTCKRLVVVLRKKFRAKVSRVTMWRRLRELGLTYKKPERRYLEASKELKDEWLKKTVPQIKKTVKKYRAILYFEDEARVRLTATLAKTWSPKGVTPTQEVTGNRSSISAMSAISGSGQLLFRLYDCNITSQQIVEFLEQMLKHHSRRHLVVVMDGARCHTSKYVKDFLQGQPRLHVFYLPPYSLEFNPDEKVWEHLKNQELKSHQATTKNELRDLTQKKMLKMSKQPDLLQGLFFRCCVADFLN